MKPSDDFEATAIYVHNTFLIQSAPESNYGAKGVMSLYHSPIMQLDEAHCMIFSVVFIRHKLFCISICKITKNYWIDKM